MAAELFDWGKHLRADFVHDGYASATYNIGGTAAQRVPDRGVEYNEDTFWDYVMEITGGDPNLKARFDGRIRFEVPEETEAFKPLPMLAATGNESIGIVMDAGANITKELGAKNVITFGMCLDPASSPIQPNRNPIYFDPTEGRSVDINLSQFGFEPTAIRGIQIVDVVENGAGVKTLWTMGNGAVYDPMRGRVREGDEPVGTKRINKIGGRYSGKKTATTLEDMIGKTLGDTMIIASAMPSFVGGVENPYYGHLPGNWKQFGTENVVTAEERPTSLAVKTGDRLNAVRAIFKNVPVILEKYEGDRVIKVFEYYPSTAAPAEIVGRIAPSYATIIRTATMRYDALIDKFRNATNSPDDPVAVVLQGSYSRFVVGSTRPTTTLVGEENLRTAGKLFRRIRSRLEQLKAVVIEYFTNRQALFAGRAITAADTFELIMRDYNFDLEALKNLCPQTDTIVRDDRTKVMNPIIPITREVNIGRVVPDIEIRLLTAFQAIRNNGDIRNTVYFQRFEAPLDTVVGALAEPALPQPPDGGAIAAGIATTLEGELTAYAQDVIGEGGVRIGGQRGDAHTIQFNRDNGAMDAVMAATAPILTRFVDYCARVIPNPDRTEYVKSVYRLLRSKDSPRIVSPVLLERIEAEFRHLADTGVLTLSFGEPIELPVSTNSSLVYNAFAMSTNRLNLKDSDIGFGYLEQKFLEAIRPVAPARTSAGEVHLVSDTETPPVSPLIKRSASAPVGDYGAELPPTPPPTEFTGIEPGTLSFGERFQETPEGSPARPIAKRPRASSLTGESSKKARAVAEELAARDSPPRPGAGTWAEQVARMGRGPTGGRRTPRRKNRKSTYRLKKKAGK